MDESATAGAGGPVAIVTGAGTGIGRAVCERLAARGFRLVLAGRRREPLEQVAEAVDAECLIVPTDLGDPAQAQGLIDAAVGGFGRLDVLVNNAGAGALASVEDHTPEMIRGMLEVNVLGPAAAIARAWRPMREQGEGCIVNVSSRASVDPFPGFFAYSATKAAVNLLSLSAAREGAPLGIRVFCVAPGAVETPLLRSLFDESAIPRGAPMEPDEVARVIEQCIIGERDDQAGQTIPVWRDR